MAKKFPHIMNYKAFKVPHAMDVEKVLKCQLAIAAFSGMSYLYLLPTVSLFPVYNFVYISSH